MPKLLLVVAGPLLLLGGCGAQRPGEYDPVPAQVTRPRNVTPPPDWNATNACRVIDGAAMARILGQSVTATSLHHVSQSDGTTAATSECSYRLANGGAVSVMLRWSPIGDNSAGSINLTRTGLEQALKGFGGHVETIDSLGKAAFWAGMTKSLNLFIGEDKFAIITLPASASAKEQAVAIAHMLGA